MQENSGPRKCSTLRDKAARADVTASSLVALLQEPVLVRQHMQRVIPKRQPTIRPSDRRIALTIGSQARRRTQPSPAGYQHRFEREVDDSQEQGRLCRAQLACYEKQHIVSDARGPSLCGRMCSDRRRQIKGEIRDVSHADA